MRLIQHKQEAYWFYRFLSIFYDKYVNPLFWTEYMRDQSLELAILNDKNLTVIDVGSGTGFTTQGITKYITPQQITCIDQSPHQMHKAKLKSDLKGCTFIIGDAENIPFEKNTFDRYISAGSIEYWPDPQKGIQEAMRVIKPGGTALMIGPLQPANKLGRFIANTWMLFPKEIEYVNWYKNAGFQDIKIKYIKPQWFKSKHEYGIAIAGVKPLELTNEIPVEPKSSEEKHSIFRPLQIFWRVLIGSLAGFLFIPVALFGYFKNLFVKKESDRSPQYKERLNKQQVAVLIFLALIIIFVILLIVRR